MNELAEFLKGKLAGRGDQSSLARKLKTNTGNVSRWVDGSVRPDFQSCLRLALYFNLDPMELMRKAGLPEDDLELLERFAPDYRPAAEEDLYGDPHEIELHRRLHTLLETGLFGKGDPFRIFEKHDRFMKLMETLQQAVKEAGGREALLMSDDRVIWEWGNPGDDRSLILSGRSPTGWRQFAHASDIEQGFRWPLRLHVRKPTAFSKVAEMSLGWALKMASAGLTALTGG